MIRKTDIEDLLQLFFVAASGLDDDKVLQAYDVGPRPAVDSYLVLNMISGPTTDPIGELRTSENDESSDAEFAYTATNQNFELSVQAFNTNSLDILTTIVEHLQQPMLTGLDQSLINSVTISDVIDLRVFSIITDNTFVSVTAGPADTATTIRDALITALNLDSYFSALATAAPDGSDSIEITGDPEELFFQSVESDGISLIEDQPMIDLAAYAWDDPQNIRAAEKTGYPEQSVFNVSFRFAKGKEEDIEYIETAEMTTTLV